jgi:hypothetical protein
MTREEALEWDQRKLEKEKLIRRLLKHRINAQQDREVAIHAQNLIQRAYQQGKLDAFQIALEFMGEHFEKE